MRSHKSLFLFLLTALALLLPTPISAQSEGDVRLADGPLTNLGRLEIFWQGQWSTFCGLSTGGAQAACRQLGFLDFVSYKPLEDVNKNLNITEATPDTPIAIDHTKCSRSFANGLLHVLRCGYNTELASDCRHSNDIVLQCQTTPLWTHPYETQVRLGTLSGIRLSAGTLEVFLGGRWGNVCGKGFSGAAADSACRQMGYTNAEDHSTTSKPSTNTTWLNDVSCKAGPCTCLAGCLNKVPTTPTSCPSQEFAKVVCTYDVTIEKEAPSGSQDVCENRETACSATTDSPGHGGNHFKLSGGDIAGVVVGGVLGVGLAIVGVTVCALFWVGPRWKRSKYSSVQ